MEVVISGLAKAKMGVQHDEIDYGKWTNVMEDPFVLEMRARHERLIYEWNTYLLWLRENDPAMWETYKIAMEFWGEIRELAGPDMNSEQLGPDGDSGDEYNRAASATIRATFRQGNGKIATAPAEPRNDRESMRPTARGPPGERVRMRRKVGK